MSLTYQPVTQMKYKEYRDKEEIQKLINDDNYVMTMKKDGASYMLCKDADGTIHFYSGTISKKDNLPIDKIENVPHLKLYAERYFPPETMVIGEVCSYYDFTKNEYTAHTSSKQVTSIMGSLPAKAIQRQESVGFVRFYMFDILFFEGKPVYEQDFAVRHDMLKDIEATGTIEEFNRPEEEQIDHMYPGCKIDMAEYVETAFLKDKILNQWFDNGEEGAVFYRLHTDGKKGADYVLRPIGQPALRRDNGVKVKTQSTYDVVILGVTMPDKEYNGKYAEDYEYRDEEGNPVNRLWALGYANAFIIGIRDGDKECPIGTVASGLTDEIRKAAGEDPDSFYGKVIEVRCMSCDNEAHTLRHPVFLRFRDDKTAEECTWDTIFK